MPNTLLGYLGRALLAGGLALVLAVLGVALARLGLVLFGWASWAAWVASFTAGAGVGAGLGSLLAWLWLKGVGAGFTVSLAVAAVAAGLAGGWVGYQYGLGVETECCARPTMGPVACTVLGAVIGSNLAALLLGSLGPAVLRYQRRGRIPAGPPPAQAN